MPVITKKREVRPGLQPCWRIHSDGRRTPLFIEKASERRKWGVGQEFDLCHDVAGYITHGSLHAMMQAVQNIATAVAP